MAVKWRWHMIPETEHAKIIEAWDREDFAGLAAELNKHRVVPGNLPECCAYEQLITQVPKAIRDGIIKHQKQPTKMSKGKFTKKTTYYTGTVYEWNLPTGSTCPFALECKVTVDRETGKFKAKKGEYRCYAASAERFPAVREHRWNNFEYVKSGGIPKIPKGCTAIRIHMSGDFFNQQYFDTWVKLAKENPEVEMWAYTKSVQYWVNRIEEIPKNLTLTASYGGSQDKLIKKHNLKNVIVYKDASTVPKDRPIDNNDDWARKPGINFALLDNTKVPKKRPVPKFKAPPKNQDG